MSYSYGAFVLCSYGSSLVVFNVKPQIIKGVTAAYSDYGHVQPEYEPKTIFWSLDIIYIA